MKSILLGLLVLFLSLSASTVAFARTPLMECNITSGRLQQISVYSYGHGLLLETLDAQGWRHESALSEQSWKRQRLTIPCPRSRSKCGVVYFQRGGWSYDLASLGQRNVGDCR